MASKKKVEVEDAAPASVSDPAPDEKCAQGSIPHLVLSPDLIETIHAHRVGKATNAQLSEFWSAAYAAVGPPTPISGRTYGK